MDLFHKIMALVDKNSESIPEGDYLQLCDTIQELREYVKPPSFLDQTRPTWISDYDPESDEPLRYEPTRVHLNGPIPDGQPHDLMDDELPSDPDTAAQRDREQFHQRWRERSGDDEEDRYPGLNAFLHELHTEWAASDDASGPVEPGVYYPPHDGTTVAEVVMMDVD
jgi:hypothetical protein|tara:strand:+ start:512 stop:1012 length:501 start_codon:yes stop_codon:yes gene_type:complete